MMKTGNEDASAKRGLMPELSSSLGRAKPNRMDERELANRPVLTGSPVLAGTWFLRDKVVLTFPALAPFQEKNARKRRPASG